MRRHQELLGIEGLPGHADKVVLRFDDYDGVEVTTLGGFADTERRAPRFPVLAGFEVIWACGMAGYAYD
jgi:hypothetical protein